MDAGPILRQPVRALNGDERADELLTEMFELGTAELLDALPSVWDGSCESTMYPQDGEKATKAAKVQKAEAQVSLDELSALAVHNRGRGFAGWPGICTLICMGDGKPPVNAKLLRTAVASDLDATLPTGTGDDEERQLTLAPKGRALLFNCADGSVLEVSSIQLPNKKPTDAKSFWNGLNGRTARWVGKQD